MPVFLQECYSRWQHQCQGRIESEWMNSYHCACLTSFPSEAKLGLHCLLAQHRSELSDHLAAGIAAGEELNVGSVTKDMGAETGQVALADAAFEAVTKLYVELESKVVKRSAPQ